MKDHGNVYPLRIADAACAIRHVFVRDLELDARIGVHGHEKGRKQPIRINLDLTVSEQSDHVDQLGAVVCYEDAVRKIKAIIDAGHVNLVETLAERIAEACLEDRRVQVARVRVEKLAAIAEARSVGVEIERAAGQRP